MDLTALFYSISLYIDRDSHVGIVVSIVPDELQIFSTIDGCAGAIRHGGARKGSEF